MALTKKQRAQVWGKSGGKCWYCGCDLTTSWHADHLEPVFREPAGKTRKPERDNIANIVPACAPCNRLKATCPLELFREEIELQAERARRSSVNFRTAERFGLIKVTTQPIVFWFEKHGL